MTHDEFERQVAGIGALDDAVRRELYLYVSSQSAPVSRDQAAAALDLPRHRAKFHLDRLEEAGLLTTGYTRLTGRSGPGAGRPAKVYQRSEEEISVSLPERSYALAGELMAEAISRAGAEGTDVDATLQQVARERGHDLGAGVAWTDPDLGAALEVAADALARHGYEPRVADDEATLANCPFHALAQTHTELVCTMNHALLSGFCAASPGLEARLDPAADRCCVVVSARG